MTTYLSVVGRKFLSPSIRIHHLGYHFPLASQLFHSSAALPVVTGIIVTVENKYHQCVPIVNCLTLCPAMPGRSPAPFCLYIPLMCLPSIVVLGVHSHRRSKRIPYSRRHRPSLPHAQKHLFCSPRFSQMVLTVLLLSVVHTTLF